MNSVVPVFDSTPFTPPALAAIPVTVNPAVEDLAVEDPGSQVRAIVRAMRRLSVGNGKLRSRLANDLGISVVELNALAHVSDAHGLTPKQLAHELHLTTGSITTLSDRLESSGFLVRKPNPADRRSLLLQLTPAGKHAIAWVYEQFAAAVITTMTRDGNYAVPGIIEFMETTAHALNKAAEKPQDEPSS
ncbi:MarR family transcriptional regulator [Paenarthrobacter sp. Z7-10]|uniref:MarR family winged helix-turn-helix transcriptional regulator n=1 Tax=Paenarthrobacter sp. Z7-10 TaxID=2787635 RepID=UPI0022A91A0C|nr:MarR family transcriptional regulator [Paenarthrobacter sp. Z7-10]MCZ2404799.1 MarR family transcriptional regulator [Paenarthrobacter sp. Z7-10]